MHRAPQGFQLLLQAIRRWRSSGRPVSGSVDSANSRRSASSRSCSSRTLRDFDGAAQQVEALGQRFVDQPVDFRRVLNARQEDAVEHGRPDVLQQFLHARRGHRRAVFVFDHQPSDPVARVVAHDRLLARPRLDRQRPAQATAVGRPVTLTQRIIKPAQHGPDELGQRRLAGPVGPEQDIQAAGEAAEFKVRPDTKAIDSQGRDMHVSIPPCQDTGRGSASCGPIGGVER